MLSSQLIVLNIVLGVLCDSGGFFVTAFIMYFLNKILFLQKHTEKQQRTIKRLFIVYGVLIAVYVVFEMVFALMLNYYILHKDIPGYTDSSFAIWLKSFYDNLFKPIDTALWYAAGVGQVVVLAYVSITGRKKHKLLGLPATAVLFGYAQMLRAVTDIPAYFLAGVSKTLSYLWTLAAWAALLAVFAYFSSPKHAPVFMRRIDEEADSRSLSFAEEAGIWAIGLWMAIYNSIFPSLTNVAYGIESTDISIEATVYMHISNLVLGVVITAMIINASYRRLYSEKNTKLQKSLISAMANLVESRDDNTGGHIHRTAKYVEIIALRLRANGSFPEVLTDRYIEDMVIAAPLHDVGKIHIPDAVLNKPGKLDDEEFRTMKTHSAAGGEIIERVEDEVGDVSYLSIAKDMAEYHHERIDGRGYPHGISGDEIPLCAKILAVADVFDALISKRCYKEPMPLDTAFAIIQEESGTHFDERIAEAFIQSREEVERFLEAQG